MMETVPDLSFEDEFKYLIKSVLSDDSSNGNSTQIDNNNNTYNLDKYHTNNTIDNRNNYEQPRKNNNNHKRKSVSSSSSSSSSSVESKKVIKVVPKSETHPKYQVIPGRSRKYNPAFLPQLRVLKRDIRRKYIEMYSTVRNHHNPTLMQAFLKEFCSPNCELLIYYPATSSLATQISAMPSTTSSYIASSCNLSFPTCFIQRFGINSIFVRHLDLFTKFPDFIDRFDDAHIRVPLDSPAGESKIEATQHFKGTRMYDLVIPPNIIIPSLEILINKASVTTATTTAAVTSASCSSLISTLSSSTDSGGGYSPLLQESNEKISSLLNVDSSDVQVCYHSSPMEISCVATFTMTLDVQNRIKQIKTEISEFKETKINLLNV